MDRLSSTTTFCSLKNVFTSQRMNQYSIFTSSVVTSDVISAKLGDINILRWEYRAEFFVISYTNLNRKMGYKCNNFCGNKFFWA